MKRTFRIANIGELGELFWVVQVTASEIAGSDHTVTTKRRMIARALGVRVEDVAFHYPGDGTVRGTPPYPSLIAVGQKLVGAPWQTWELTDHH